MSDATSKFIGQRQIIMYVASNQDAALQPRSMRLMVALNGLWSSVMPIQFSTQKFSRVIRGGGHDQTI